MKIQGRMITNFLYDDETDGMVVEHKVKSDGEISVDVVQRAYIALGYHIHSVSVRAIYNNDGDPEYIKKLHDELLELLKTEND